MQHEADRTTRLLLRLTDGDHAAGDELMPLVYDELRALAAGYLRRERPDHTLQPTALVHEAYLRLVGGGGVDWRSRAHFFAVAARVMRNTLVNHALAHKAEKRGGAALRLDLQSDGVAAPSDGVDTLALDDALKRLAALDPRKSEVVELRFFGGMSVEEAAEVLSVSVSTVEADWRVARAWLSSELSGR